MEDKKVKKQVRKTKGTRGKIVPLHEAKQDITERKQVEKKYRKLEANYRAIFDAANDAIFIHDIETGAILDVNQRMCEMFGYSREEARKLNVQDLSSGEHPYTQEEALRRIKEAAKGEPQLFEWRAKDKSGRFFWAEVNLKCAVIGGKKVLLAILRDISERKEASQEIASYSERLKYLLGATTVVIYTAQTGGDYEATFISDNVEKVTGYKARQFVEDRSFWISNVHPDDLEQVYSEVSKLFEGGEHTYEYRFKRSDGTYIWVSDQMRLVRDAAGQPKEIVGYWMDITERKRAEEALRESEERYRAIFEQAADSIVLVDGETGALLEFNDKAHENLGYTHEEFRKLKIPDFEVIESTEEVAKHIEKIIREGADTFETRHRRKDGQIRDIVVSSRAISIGGKDFVQSIWRDVTERKRAEEKLLEDKRQLCSLASELSLTEERERRDIAKGLHDDIIQPLVFLDVKLKSLLKRDAGRELSDSSEQVQEIIAKLIDEIRTVTFDLSSPVLYELGLEAAVKEWLTTEVEEKHGLKTVFKGDGLSKRLGQDMRGFLYKAVRELVTNIIKHANARNIEVSISTADGNVIISVRDDGKGFDVRDKEKLRFNKHHGYGLFNIRERLKSYGGALAIDSKIGKGTEIIITMPLSVE